ncbi:hypothetical protein GYH30_009943 [Glycine max]|uniref:RNase H type-1 domain-containing protein n=1 Tax=Glycine max TaxID=3847 RepID=A0A0R0KEZ7_SOYBN|nr:hypothetical protein JHK86_010164 [Glycine max]KAH1111368.1 hypothetical protein GYH30_009943 [Glycine max]
MAWSIELLEYKIQYEPRGTIKAQSLIDFMNEFHPPILKPPDEWWELNIDESSNQHNNGAWVTLEGSNNVALAKSLHFRFKATNNQAEYEALLVGLRLAKEVRARKVAQYVIIAGELYRRGFSSPLLKCLNKEQADYVLKELHEGLCEMHLRGRSIEVRVIRARYY